MHFSISYLEFVFDCFAVFLLLLMKFSHAALSLNDELGAGGGGYIVHI